ncbi:sterol desaturase family protein [Marinobacter salinexigens]|uniref:Sterol desaturase family protein n=1 Tax=Marinobacter salinexigens TaxID=2919747 RepID=A0A5B0VNN9_9GAMM|nr:sterol desaturase family protein [Marinobacter salinexigens]KAA1176177.1 sterol desaturase family protein [Marinobacter salinexigens]
MDAFRTVLEYLNHYIIDPVTDQFLGIFDLNGRLGVVFLGISLLVAYGLFRFRIHQGTAAASTFWQFLGGNRVNFHRSALLDYRYYLIRAILKVTLVLPVVALVDPYVFRSGDYIAFFTNLWGARPQLGENLSLTLLYGLGLFLLHDFKHYWVHRAFHSKWLWEFHKVHHSAPVLVPATASRIHFVEKIVERIATAVLVGGYAGAFWYACGGEISRYTLFGVTYLTFIFNSLAANLRHSHVWFSFGPALEHIFNSPAQHQIHHSDAPRHFNKNFGTNLSLWDWMFGTLYVTSAQQENIRFGTGSRDAERYLTLYSLIVTPFVDIAKRLKRPAHTSEQEPA